MIEWLKRAAPSIEVAGQTLPVVIRRLPQARRLTMRLAPDGSEVRVSIPRWGRTAEALEFAQSRAAWLETQLAKISAPTAFDPASGLPYRGAVLPVAHDPAHPRKPRLTGDALILGGPATGLPSRLRRWLEGEARALFAEDLTEYCARAAKPEPRLMLSSAQRRWGSCATTGTIRLNWRLVMAPDFVRRSVVAHEVSHLVHMDHSPRFHALLDELYEHDIKAANRWLKREGRSLYAPFG